MKSGWLRALFFVLLLVGVLPAARATLTCTSITSPGISINYVNGTTTSVQTYFTVSCTRTSSSDPSSVSYAVTADNGLHYNGQNNNAMLGATPLRYDVFTSSSCGTTWKGNRTISDTISWSGSSTGTVTKQTSFWGCIMTAQTLTSSGNYGDTVGLTLSYNGLTITGTVPVSIYAPALCTVTQAPTRISLAYAAFGSQQSGNTTFGLTCTNGMPYTIATDVPEAVLNGLRYILSLSATAANGTGGPQNYTITATIPAGQAGACTGPSCSALHTHTLTITY